MKLILHQATLAITEIDFVPGPFRCQIEQQHLDFAVERETISSRVIDCTGRAVRKQSCLFDFEALQTRTP